MTDEKVSVPRAIGYLCSSVYDAAAETADVPATDQSWRQQQKHEVGLAALEAFGRLLAADPARSWEMVSNAVRDVNRKRGHDVE